MCGVEEEEEEEEEEQEPGRAFTDAFGSRDPRSGFFGEMCGRRCASGSDRAVCVTVTTGR